MILGERYVMPRHVARYFMERRHHRRRIPTASRYISGCTVNPARVRLFASCTGGGHPSSENDRLPPSLTPLLLLYSRYVYAAMYVYARIYVSSFLLPAVVAGLPLASAPLPSRALERALPPLVVRVLWLLFLPEFFLLSTVRVPDYSRLRLPCSPDG